MIKGFLLLQALPQGPLHSKEHNKSPDSILRERGWLDTEGTKALYRPPRDPPLAKHIHTHAWHCGRREPWGQRSIWVKWGEAII